MDLLIRPALAPGDYPGIAAVLSAESPQWPTHPDRLAFEDRVRASDSFYLRLVALDATQPESPIVGVGTLEHDPLAHRAGKLLVDIRVPPDLQGRGIGSQLYNKLIEQAALLNPHQLQTSVWWTLTKAIQFVQYRGFRETWRRIDSCLDVSIFNSSSYLGLAERVRDEGIEIKTYADLPPETRLEKLWQLDGALWADVPYGEPVPPKSLAQFAREEIESPRFLPDACFIAIHNNNFIGYSNITHHDTQFVNEMTGVLPAYRGKSIATLLKIHTIQYAQAHGNLKISTTNDSVNNAMLALNTKLGFVREGETIRFVKDL
jgi:mycothiol synthase